MNRNFRLSRSSDFLRVRRSGKSYAHALVVLIADPNPQAELRIGIAASHSVGNAVQRNRAKRRIRACMDSFLPYIPVGWNLVLIARRPLVEAPYAALQAALHQLLRRAGLLSEPTENGT